MLYAFQFMPVTAAGDGAGTLLVHQGDAVGKTQEDRVTFCRQFSPVPDRRLHHERMPGEDRALPRAGSNKIHLELFFKTPADQLLADG